ncbi:FecR domain-containing protein [Winogradskyella sp. 3972H.M.0a.05]|uniref:FecR family protein n=1 Tax=Winogradskyella sp. 3972H.M.0a.05 TaxID=2950277 RepID=UPI0033970CD7
MAVDKDQLIEKWLRDDLSESEKLAFSQLEDADFNEKIVEAAKAFRASNQSKTESFQSFKDAYAVKSNKKTFRLNTFLKIAGVFVVGIGLYLLTLISNGDTTFETSIAEKLNFKLPDNSEVALNAQSQVTFNENTWNDKRLVNLIGEAYFKVEKGATFDVLTESGTVTVVGTEFNVKQRNKMFLVECFEGKVRVLASGEDELLEAGDSFRLINGEISKDTTVNTQPDWTTNKSNFERIPFSEVIDELERQYEIEIRLQDVENSRLFTGGFPHENIESALIAITKPMNLTYKILETNQVVIHGQDQ